MKKITFFRTAFMAVGMTLAMGNAFAQTQVANIAALRAAFAANSSTSIVYQITGEVVTTFVSGATSTYTGTRYVQDATGGLMIYDSSSNKKITTQYNQYDGITGLTGKLSLYQGMLELIPTADPGAATSTGNTVTPREVTYSDLVNYPGQLCVVRNVTIAPGTGTWVKSSNYQMTVNGVASGSNIIIWPGYTECSYIGSSIPTAPQDIVGLVCLYTNGTKIEYVPRTAADFVPSLTSLVENTKEEFILSAAKSVIKVSALSGEKVEVYNSIGKKLVSKIAAEGENNISVSSKGIMLVKVGNRSGKVIL